MQAVRSQTLGYQPAHLAEDEGQEEEVNYSALSPEELSNLCDTDVEARQYVGEHASDVIQQAMDWYFSDERAMEIHDEVWQESRTRLAEQYNDELVAMIDKYDVGAKHHDLCRLLIGLQAELTGEEE